MSHAIPRLLLVLAVLGPARTAAAQVTRVGAHYGVNLTNGDWEDPRLGLQGVAHLVRAVEVSGTFSYLTTWPRSAGVTGTARQVYGALRVRGPRHWAFASAGYGPVFTHTSLRDPATGLASTVNNLADCAVLGLEVPTPHVRPFADLYLSHLLDHGIMGVNLLMGLHLLMPRR